MEKDCSNQFIPSQEHEIPISTPDFSIWEAGFDQILFHNDPTNLEGNKMGEGDLQVIEDARINEVEKKKLHKEIERQRRKEMAALYDSLRSVLPSNSIKVKKQFKLSIL